MIGENEPQQPCLTFAHFMPRHSVRNVRFRKDTSSIFYGRMDGLRFWYSWRISLEFFRNVAILRIYVELQQHRHDAMLVIYSPIGFQPPKTPQLYGFGGYSQWNSISCHFSFQDCCWTMVTWSEFWIQITPRKLTWRLLENPALNESMYFLSKVGTFHSGGVDTMFL